MHPSLCNGYASALTEHDTKPIHSTPKKNQGAPFFKHPFRILPLLHLDENE